MNADEAIERAVKEIHHRFTSGSDAPENIVRSEKDMIWREIGKALNAISHYELRRCAKDRT